MKNIPINTVVQMNEIKDALSRGFSMPVINIGLLPVCELTELSWHSRIKNPHLWKVLCQLDVEGLRFVAVAVPNDAEQCFDVVVLDAEGNGWQLLPNDPKTAYKYKEEELDKASDEMLRFLMDIMSRSSMKALENWYAASVKQLRENQ